MTQIIQRALGLAAIVGAALAATACGCPTTAGPTAPIVSISATLAPGEFRYLDVDTPSSTTQINLQFTVSSTSALLVIRQIDPGCVPNTADGCTPLNQRDLTARPAGVNAFGSGLPVVGTRTRVVVQNGSPDETVTITMSVEPHRAGCT